MYAVSSLLSAAEPALSFIFFYVMAGDRGGAGLPLGGSAYDNRFFCGESDNDRYCRTNNNKFFNKV